ncbi:polyribonucleotide nucleotidyltransferase [Haploplasma axanthum]|uniref:Polyribonucleotide nucleotidyltransferase n=1 Tax=Haploplasma axanthum TaxID=29552 RepID=A0A449BE97_HAPAX|nr:polyribonucleotide nucleotidyltransferase [Haploplasma axanthum]VEU80784.1 Polyribonucleotide nucleotidyltransferase [Haploplasma axanthum]
MSLKTFETNFGGRTLKVEIGEVAKQTNASALLHYGGTSVLSVVVNKNEPTDGDFFPLMVLYQEKLYAAGKIPGGFLKREGRATEHETLISRLIDRPVRPLFADGFKNDVQIINTVLSSDPTCPPEMVALLGSSLVLQLSDLPFKGPVSGVTLGMINNEFVVNPTEEEMETSILDLTVAGTTEALNMVEASAKEVSEELMLNALSHAHSIIKELNEFQNVISKELGKVKKEYDVFTLDKDIEKEVLDYIGTSLVDAVSIFDKLERYAKIDEIKAKTLEHFKDRPFFKIIDNISVYDYKKEREFLGHVEATLNKVVKNEVRRLITKEKIRPDGRKTDEIRPLASRVGLLERTHGSSLFTRGQTQALAVVTLGGLGEGKIIDDIRDEDNKRFMLHYNFPQFSVGETGRYGAPGRREIGHGALGEKAIKNILPNEEEFPYTIRVVSEILESNGSSSQATICAATMALMNAGVPIKAPVAGIAMGLVMEGKDYTILTDIQGMEDHEGDMDFKVAGSREGITALQMDIKIDGITNEIFKEALEQAKVARFQLLDHMHSTIAEVSSELSPYAPKVKLIKIDPEKIRDVIGTGGKIITQIIEDNNNVKIDIEQDGRVFIMHSETEVINRVANIILNIVRVPEVGKIYEGKVVRVEKFGAFVELWAGTEGLVHISKLSKDRVNEVTDVVNVGDAILVKCIKIDEKGRVDLSRKDALEDK